MWALHMSCLVHFRVALEKSERTTCLLPYIHYVCTLFKLRGVNNFKIFKFVKSSENAAVSDEICCNNVLFDILLTWIVSQLGGLKF